MALNSSAEGQEDDHPGAELKPRGLDESSCLQSQIRVQLLHHYSIMYSYTQ